MKYPLVEIEWLDITSNVAWVNQETIEASRPRTCYTVGYLYSKDANITRLFSTHCPDDSIDDEPYSDIRIFPTGCIVNIRKLR